MGVGQSVGKTIPERDSTLDYPYTQLGSLPTMVASELSWFKEISQRRISARDQHTFGKSGLLYTHVSRYPSELLEKLKCDDL